MVVRLTVYFSNIPFRSCHHSFIHLVVCLMTGPKPLPKRALHIVRSRASSFRCEYLLLSIRLSTSFLRLHPRLPITSIPPFISPLITCRKTQFLRKIWPIQLAFRLFISYRVFLCYLALISHIIGSLKTVKYPLQYNNSPDGRSRFTSQRCIRAYNLLYLKEMDNIGWRT
jgi:hypothetical protein